MARKHNAKHQSRGVSNYPARLADRGESSASVRMTFPCKSGHKHNTAESWEKCRKGAGEDML